MPVRPAALDDLFLEVPPIAVGILYIVGLRIGGLDEFEPAEAKTSEFLLPLWIWLSFRL
jgi:hypothetical protein